MKKWLTPCLAIIAIVAIVLCFVLKGDKPDVVQKKIDDAVAAKATELNAKISDLEQQLADANAAKDEALKAAEEASEAKSSLQSLQEALQSAKDEAEKLAKEQVEAAVKAAQEEAEAVKKQLEEKVAALETQMAEAKTAEEAKTEETKTEEPKTEDTPELAKVMSYEDYVNAELDSEVTIETYVQANQAWWDNKITIYAQSPDGAYFIYNAACTEEEAAKLVPGTKIHVNGFKSEWSGETEITDAKIEIVEGGDTFIATPEDITDVLGSDDLIKHQNELVTIKGLTVEAQDDGAAFNYKNAENKTDDLYFKVSKDGKVYDFIVEFYLCGQDTEVYKAVEALQVGDVIDVDAYLYWYNGANPHTIKVTKAN